MLVADRDALKLSTEVCWAGGDPAGCTPSHPELVGEATVMARTTASTSVADVGTPSRPSRSTSNVELSWRCDRGTIVLGGRGTYSPPAARPPTGAIVELVGVVVVAAGSVVVVVVAGAVVVVEGTVVVVAGAVVVVVLVVVVVVPPGTRQTVLPISSTSLYRALSAPRPNRYLASSPVQVSFRTTRCDNAQVPLAGEGTRATDDAWAPPAALDTSRDATSVATRRRPTRIVPVWLVGRLTRSRRTSGGSRRPRCAP